MRPRGRNLKTLIEDYLDHLRSRHFSKASLALYGLYLEGFRRWCSARHIGDPQRIGEARIESYEAFLCWYRKADGRPLDEGSRVARLALLGRFFRWLYRRRLVLRDPTRLVRISSPPPRLPVGGLTEGEIDAIMAQPDVRTDLGMRDRAILETLYGTGIRRGELLGLTLTDLDVSGGTVLIRRGKGGKDRIVPLGERAGEWLKRYLIEARPALVRSRHEPTLFLTRYGRPLEGKGLEHRVREYRRQAGIRRVGGCHEFRHAMALGMLRNGADIRSIQEILGHANVSMTARYTEVLIGDVKAVHTKTHPLG